MSSEVKESPVCSICHEEYLAASTIIICRNSHILHQQCLLSMLQVDAQNQKETLCPMCREPLLDNVRAAVALNPNLVDEKDQAVEVVIEPEAPQGEQEPAVQIAEQLPQGPNIELAPQAAEIQAQPDVHIVDNPHPNAPQDPVILNDHLEFKEFYLSHHHYLNESSVINDFINLLVFNDIKDENGLNVPDFGNPIQKYMYKWYHRVGERIIANIEHDERSLNYAYVPIVCRQKVLQRVRVFNFVSYELLIDLRLYYESIEHFKSFESVPSQADILKYMKTICGYNFNIKNQQISLDTADAAQDYLRKIKEHHIRNFRWEGLKDVISLSGMK